MRMQDSRICGLILCWLWPLTLAPLVRSSPCRRVRDDIVAKQARVLERPRAPPRLCQLIQQAVHLVLLLISQLHTPIYRIHRCRNENCQITITMLCSGMPHAESHKPGRMAHGAFSLQSCILTRALNPFQYGIYSCFDLLPSSGLRLMDAATDCDWGSLP